MPYTLYHLPVRSAQICSHKSCSYYIDEIDTWWDNFTNILCAPFSCADPISAKNTYSQAISFCCAFGLLKLLCNCFSLVTFWLRKFLAPKCRKKARVKCWWNRHLMGRERGERGWPWWRPRSTRRRWTCRSRRDTRASEQMPRKHLRCSSSFFK